MKRIVTGGVCVLALAAQMTAGAPDPRRPIHSFRPAATFLVPDRNSAEIVAATPDGMTLVYTDAIGNTLGIVDIADPARPVQVATIAVGGQPTSVAITPDGRYALAAVRRTLFAEGQAVDPAAPAVPGELHLFDLQAPGGPPLVYPIQAGPGGALGYLPDALAIGVIAGQVYAAVALENEPIVLEAAGGTYAYADAEPAGLPACPAAPGVSPCDASAPGYVQVVRIDTVGPALRFVSNAAFESAQMDDLFYPEDPQPEFVAFKGTNVAVTLQENNGLAVVDLAVPSAPHVSVFSAGVVSSRTADLLDDSRISFTQTYPDDAIGDEHTAGTRIPDAVAWSDDGTRLLTANEGEFSYTGGRGWSIFHVGGTLLWDDGGALEATAVRRGYYPEGRSDAKGIEPEGMAAARMGQREFAFVTSERGSFVAVYDIDGPQPRFLQLLPTGLAPEAALAIPSRGLFVTANEGDDGDGSLSIFEGVTGLWKGTLDQPLLESASFDEPWSALSGFATDPRGGRAIFAVPDNALASEIYRIDIAATTARVRAVVPVTRAGQPAGYDLEGIAVDTSIEAPTNGAGFWLVTEGNASCNPALLTRNLLVQVDARGEMRREIGLPASVEPGACAGAARPAGAITSNGFEGVALTADGRYLLVAVQRPFAGEVPSAGASHTRVARYDLLLEQWDYFAYPLVQTPAATIGLSEITPFNRTDDGREIFAVIERDNRYGLRAAVKQITTFTLPSTSCSFAETLAACVGKGGVIGKTRFEDLLDEFSPLEKIESLAVLSNGDVWVAVDNDGGEVEPRLVRIRKGH